tara:strand:+ start:4838 stop:5149 length:312 start_codon:yes stop_codon:yes gene_type:complete
MNDRKNPKRNKKSHEKDKSGPQLLTAVERNNEVYIIIKKLSELQLTMAYDPIRQLFIILQNYKKNGKRIQINIPFPMINKRIKGILSDTVNEKCWIKLEHEVY